MNQLLVKCLRPDAVLPCRATPHSMGYDLCLPTEAQSVFIHSGEPTLIKLGFALAIPAGFYGRIAPRSGLAVKFGVDVMAGVIDPDYRGEIGVVLVVLKAQSLVKLEPGSAIAQLILERADALPVIEVADLDATERGAGGFGSTGMSSAATTGPSGRAEWIVEVEGLPGPPYPNADNYQGLLQLRKDAGGWRHYVGDRPLYCGTAIEIFVSGAWLAGRYEATDLSPDAEQPAAFFHRSPSGEPLIIKVGEIQVRFPKISQ